MFQFKQFSVDQSNCAMKINTDGVLLGAIISANAPDNILDIGTGTGVIALMLAQRYLTASVDAVEVDENAAKTAKGNFKASVFAERLVGYNSDFGIFLNTFPEKKYDLMVSNPPFYVDSLKSPSEKKRLAKHTDIDFFGKLVKAVSTHLKPEGRFWLILPVKIGETVVSLCADNLLYPDKIIEVKSYSDSEAHRVILSVGFNKVLPEITNFTIYKTRGVYSDEYEKLLQPYFLAF